MGDYLLKIDIIAQTSNWRPQYTGEAYQISVEGTTVKPVIQAFPGNCKLYMAHGFSRSDRWNSKEHISIAIDGCEQQAIEFLSPALILTVNKGYQPQLSEVLLEKGYQEVKLYGQVYLYHKVL